MHILVGIVLLGLLGFIAWRAFGGPARAAAPPAAGRSEQPFAFLSNGLLFLRERGAAVQQVQSPYAQEAMDRRERSRERHAWKKDTAFGIAAGGRGRRFDAADKPLQATSAAFEPAGSLIYFLRDDNVGGLFRRDTAGREERVLLKPGLELSDLNPSADGEWIAAASQQTAGVTNIAMLKPDGSSLREVTGGDTVDTAPAWVPHAPRRLLFQSAGLARDEHGYVVAMGPASIQMLDMDTGSVSPILDDARYDFLKPRVGRQGELLFIRRPYDRPRYGMENMVLDTLLFPFRLLRAVFHYLNFFSLMYSRKPLTSADGPKLQADMKNILLQGRRIDAEKAMRSASTVHGVPSLVPADWKLVARDEGGRERVLATSVASYDVGPDGTVVYSNGRGVFVLGADGASRLALADELIGEVVAAA